MGLEWPELVAALLTFSVISVALRLWRKPRYRLPPGPRGWPIFGSLLSVGEFPHHSFQKLSKKYGPLMFMHLGSVPTLVISSPEMAKEVLKTHDHIMASRPDFQAGRVISYNRKAAGYAPYGQAWRDVRKIYARELFCGAQLNRFQYVRSRELMSTLHSILDESKGGETVTMGDFLSNLTTNNITQMMMNRSYCSVKRDSMSTETVSFRDIVREMFDMEGAFNISDFIPILKPFDLQGYNKRIQNVHEKMDKFIQTAIDERLQESSSVGVNERSKDDFLHLLLSSPQGDNADILSIDGIKAIAVEMINAGTDTSATTLEWILAELLKSPGAMRKLQEELELVVGTERLVTEADIPDLKYLQAVIKEGLRLHPAAPLLGPHESIENCVIGGYDIPAGCRIFVNAWAIHRDPTLWDRPLEFDPERFINSNIDMTGQHFEFIPFGSGRRICPGINLGLIMVQYPLAQLVQAINWSLPEGENPEDMDMSEAFGLVTPRAVPLIVHAKPRLPLNVIYYA